MDLCNLRSYEYHMYSYFGRYKGMNRPVMLTLFILLLTINTLVFSESMYIYFIPQTIVHRLQWHIIIVTNKSNFQRHVIPTFQSSNEQPFRFAIAKVT